MGLAPTLAENRPFDPCVGSRCGVTFGGTESAKGRFGLRKIVPVTESQISELQNMRVLLEEARVLARNLAYHRRARLETLLGQLLDEIDRQIEDLRSNRS